MRPSMYALSFYWQALKVLSQLAALKRRNPEESYPLQLGYQGNLDYQLFLSESLFAVYSSLGTAGLKPILQRIDLLRTLAQLLTLQNSRDLNTKYHPSQKLLHRRQVS